MAGFSAIDLFTDSDTILITSLFAMHCGLSPVYEIQNKELLQAPGEDKTERGEVVKKEENYLVLFYI